MASAYFYTVCKTKCIDMNATMCATSRGMSALFGREGGMGGSECGASELWEWEPLKILLTTVCVTLMVSMCATSHGMSAVYGRLGPQEGGQDGRIRVWSRGVVGVGASLRPSCTCGFDRCPRHRGLESRLHILSTVFFNLCPLLELASDKSRLPEGDSGWSVRKAKM